MSEEQTAPQAPGSARPEQPPALTALLQETFGDRVLAWHAERGEETVTVSPEGMLELFRFLKTDERCRFEMMIDLSAVDHWRRRTPRFEVVVHLKSLALGHRLRVKIPVGEDDAEVDSIHGLWPCADWYERECWEMYGIRFRGHPKLKRLLLYEEFQGFPLRKDYVKEVQQPLVPMRPVRERYDYGETFEYPEGVLEPQSPSTERKSS